MNANDPEGHDSPAPPPAAEPQAAAAPAHDAHEGGPGESPGSAAPAEGVAAADAAAVDAQTNEGGPASEGGSAGEGGPDGGRRKKRRRGRGRGADGPGPGGPHDGPRAPQHHAPHAPSHGQHGSPQREGPGPRSYVEDRLDKDAEQLARDARSLPFSRLRPLGILAQEVRRMVATGDPRDAREARRALVLLKSRVAYLAGREQGKERSALVKVREFVFRGVDHVTRNQDAPDPEQLRNFLDGIEALVGYHRFHADDRRRD